MRRPLGQRSVNVPDKNDGQNNGVDQQQQGADGFIEIQFQSSNIPPVNSATAATANQATPVPTPRLSAWPGRLPVCLPEDD